MSNIEFVDDDYELANPLDDGGSDDNEIPTEFTRQKKKKTTKVYMKDVIDSVLRKDIKKANPILSKYKLGLKKTKKELEEKKRVKEEKLKKEERSQKGHYIPRYEVDKDHENKLKEIAMKGVIKLFNVIHEYQQNNPEPPKH